MKQQRLHPCQEVIKTVCGQWMHNLITSLREDVFIYLFTSIAWLIIMEN